MKSLHLEMVRVTEAGAIAASRFIGSGDKLGADKAATDAMREKLNNISDFTAKIALGEGIKDKSFGLYYGEIVGEDRDKYEKSPKRYSISIDPVECTRSVAYSRHGAISVLALANEGCFYPAKQFYMKKLAVGYEIASKAKLCVNDPVHKTINLISTALKKPPTKITVCVLDRPRHEELIGELRELGCRIKLIPDGDVNGAVSTCDPNSRTDILLGVGGSPEAVLGAAALKCYGGFMQCQLCDNGGKVIDDKIFEIEDLSKGDVIFCATGITDGDLLRGVGYNYRGRYITSSILMRSESGTVRRIETLHGCQMT